VSYWTAFGETSGVEVGGSTGGLSSNSFGYTTGGSEYSNHFGIATYYPAYNDSSSIRIINNTFSDVTPANKIRIGCTTGASDYQLNAAYVSGIKGITVTGSPVLVATDDQLGVISSSARFKENIVDMDNDSDKIMELRPIAFTYKKDDAKTKQYGLIAEEVAEILPELVSYDKEGLPFSVYYEKLPAMLLNELQKLNSRADAIEFKRRRI
jgi:hypothetical protein